MNTKIYPFRITPLSEFVFFFLISLSMNIFAGGKEIYENRINTTWEIASNAELDSLRGGFTLPNGVVVDFNFEKIIYRNGVEVFSSVFELPTNIQITQNGISNNAIDFANAVLNSLIQNNLDNQVIRTVNTINIDISNLKNITHNVSNSDIFRNIVMPTLIK